MHNEGNEKRRQEGSGWSLNTITSDFSDMLGRSPTQGLFSFLAPGRSLNSMGSSNTALSSSLPSQFALPPISYNELLKDLTAKFSQQGSSASSVVASSSTTPFPPILFPHDHNSLLPSQNPASNPFSLYSTSQFDTQSVNSAVNRAKKRSMAEMRRTSLPPQAGGHETAPQLKMENRVDTSNHDMESPSSSKEDCAIQKELSSILRKAAKEELRRRPAPIILDSYPRAPTPDDFGELCESNYFPTHFFKGTKMLLANGTKKLVENLISEDFVECASTSADVVMHVGTIEQIEKNASLFRVTFGVGPDKEKASVEVAPEQPFFTIGVGWSSCLPEKTLQVYGLKAKQIERGDVCITLATCQFQSEKTRRTLNAVVSPREAAVEASLEASALTTFQKAIARLPKKAKGKRRKESGRRKGRCLSEPPSHTKSHRRRNKRKRSRSVDPHWETSLPPKRPKPFSPKNNKDYPTQIAFDFEI